MALPVSVGDIIAIGKLSWDLYHAFIKGRRSAPAEFRRLENELHSLPIAIDAIEKAVRNIDNDTSSRPTREISPVTKVLEACHETLMHLEVTVQEHSDIVPPHLSGLPQTRRWRSRFVSNWKRIYWTTEKGDFAALVSQIKTHINSLELILGAFTVSSITQVQDLQKTNNSMLQEIYEWFVDNHKGRSETTPDGLLQQELSSTVERGVWFEVYLTNIGDTERQLICSHARLEPTWSDIETPSYPDPTPLPFFTCHCIQPMLGDARRCHTGECSLSTRSFPVRVAGDNLSWQLHQIKILTSDELVTLLVKNIPPRCTCQLSCLCSMEARRGTY
ncbi:hypothetical protein F4801DRAFT_446691 [Xylaria longipes]|nr:hypothetical protein F4801DRAFT_446691 [Xylaria longipes]